ncbi:MAG: HD domain-containing protein [Lachnospiraceae bacterium]|nr:HD domain-containing protein [Lachnospiraceae bacterium]
MEIVTSRDVCILCREILRLINRKISDHSSRVGYILYRMLQCEDKHEDFELAEYALLGMLHDIGAFKVDADTDVLKFDMTDVMPHSIYGSLFMKYLSPLGDERSKVIMYHHIDYKQIADVNFEYKDIANYLNLANLVDIYNNSGVRFDFNRLSNYVGTKFSKQAFDLCAQAQVKYELFDKLKNGRYRDELDEVFSNIMLSDGEKNKFVEMLMYISGFRDEYNVINTVTTTCVAMEIAERINESLSDEEMSTLYYASILHDIGMLSVPLEIIEAPRKLTPEEYARMKQHVEVADTLLRGRVNDVVADAILAHHERGDGSGYPNHKDSANMNMIAKILQVADTVTGLTCQRAYHPSKPKDAVIQILTDEVDHNRFHRGVVMTFINSYDDIMEVVARRAKEITANWSTLNKQYELVQRSLMKKPVQK